MAGCSRRPPTASATTSSATTSGPAAAAARHGIALVNAPGTIDAGYRGEVKVILINTDPAEPFTVRRGDRIAQLVVQPVVRARFVQVEELPPLHSQRSGN